jgi:microcystin-dependent protein
VSAPFVAEVRVVPYNFPPTGWAFCNGQILPISQNTALFSLLGTTYGGDGKSTFALPDCQGNCVIGAGQGSGLSLYDLGQMSGSQAVTLLTSEMPIHTHSYSQSVRPSDNLNPQDAQGNGLGLGGGNNIYAAPGPIVQLAPQALAPAGGGLPHNNMMPYLTLSYIIALQGVFPPRS